MSRYFITYSGKKFDTENFSVEDIAAEDIAHALSLLCRGSGHYARFYSVAQHSLNCYHEARARGYSDKVCIASLVHDASEAYLSDIISEFKKKMPQYLSIEGRIMTLVHKKFGLEISPEEQNQIDLVDRAVLWHELAHFLSNGFECTERPKIYAKLDIAARPLEEVEAEFLTYLIGYLKNKQN